MSARAWIHAEGAVELFEQAKAWLRRERVLLSGVSVLTRLNAVVLWNTRYIDLAVNVLRAQGYPVRNEDAARLSPLGYAHINMLGRPERRAEARRLGVTVVRPLRAADRSASAPGPVLRPATEGFRRHRATR